MYCKKHTLTSWGCAIPCSSCRETISSTSPGDPAYKCAASVAAVRCHCAEAVRHSTAEHNQPPIGRWSQVVTRDSYAIGEYKVYHK